MNKSDLEYILYRIISRETHFTFNNSKYCLKTPSPEIKQRAMEIYFDIIAEEKFGGWLRESNLTYLLITYGYWTPNTEALIKEINQKIDRAKISLYENRMNAKTVKSSRQNLNQLNNQLSKIFGQKHDLYQNTLEGYASSIKNEYVLCNCLYDNKNNKVFKFNSNNSYILFNSLIGCTNQNIISVEQLRALARDGLWRSIWNCDKKNPFGVSGGVKLSDDQRGLINFSLMYDSVYDHSECPEDFVIDDDDMLDGWMLYQKEKIKKDKTKEGISSLHKNAQEVFIMGQSSEDFERISDLNDDYSKSVIDSRLNAVKRKGQLDELDLPDIKASIDTDLAQKAANYNRK
jgi:hypothetical protein